MTTQSVDDLVLIKLPISHDGGRADVLALVRKVTPAHRTGHDAEISVVICDRAGSQVVRHFSGSTEIPAVYECRKIGGMSQFMSLHAEQVEALVLVGAAEHGNLTIARAAHIMHRENLSATDALSAALDMDHRVLAMQTRQLSMADAALA